METLATSKSHLDVDNFAKVTLDFEKLDLSEAETNQSSMGKTPSKIVASTPKIGSSANERSPVSQTRDTSWPLIVITVGKETKIVLAKSEDVTEEEKDAADVVSGKGKKSC